MKRKGYIAILLMILISLAVMALGTTFAYITTLKTTDVQTVTVADYVPSPDPAQAADAPVTDETAAQDASEDSTSGDEDNAPVENSSEEAAENNPAQDEAAQE